MAAARRVATMTVAVAVLAVLGRSEPHATRGEARAVGELIADRGWDQIVVVTSRYHLRRAGLLARQCAPEAEVALAAADDSLRPDRVLREVVALGAAATVHRAC